ncbi:MAG: adenylate/guanylate cyclase domain-containing protein, partial [Bacteroidota bacterium]|nr:adenylate/guanylate cyclase domain-containing protein [Candidatus Kapabacteria bacterium]MDW8220999.1 adenylate/guanylate cyclase domain-containing protein [Bacteroidota bacterium]
RYNDRMSSFSHNPSTLELRIGIHTGSVVAGVIGKKKFAYDLWGDTVNTASRMESQGVSGNIHVSEEFRTRFLEERLTIGNRIAYLSATTLYFIERGNITVKGKGTMRTYFLSSAPSHSAVPNLTLLR